MISLTINGKKKNFDLDPDTPLLWVLRDELGLTGTKFGCGAQLCGACTVHVDGKATRSCGTPLSEVANKYVLTVEGLKFVRVGRIVQKAWLDNDVPQCGYCQSGQIMSAVALLTGNKSPSDTEIDAAMSGNICRCGTYNQIRAAIRDASAALGGRR
jgi:isoquinoline 1-oxidoreductase alpha subunit